VESVRLELLKSTNRLENEGHGALFQTASELQSLLGIDGTISIYQMQSSEGLNAALSYFLSCDLDIQFNSSDLNS
jgi:hypothetical protein